jgi:hypothetical protein
VNLADGEVLSSKCSDIFFYCERLDAVGIVSGQLRRRQNDLTCAASAVKTDPAICIPIGGSARGYLAGVSRPPAVCGASQ